MMRTNWALAVVLAGAAALGCGSKGSGSGDAPGASGAPGAGGTAGGGLNAAGNDPAVVALAKKAITCKFSESGLEYSCADKKAWEESELTKEGKADPTLVEMLGDASEPVRYIAAYALSGKGDKFKGDKAMADKILTAAEKETSKAVARELGAVAGKIKLKDLGFVDRAMKLAKAPTMKELRKSFIGSAQFSNREEFYETTKAIAKSDPDIDLRDAAMSAYWVGTPNSKNAEVCALWLELSHDPANEEFAAHAAYFTAFYPHSSGCKAEWDTMLGDIEKGAKAGKLKSSYWGSALYYLHNQSAASDAQKKRAIAIAKTVVENAANGGSARGRALELVGEKDPTSKAFVTKFKDDKDFYVKSRAADLLKKMK